MVALVDNVGIHGEEMAPKDGYLCIFPNGLSIVRPTISGWSTGPGRARVNRDPFHVVVRRR